MPIAKSYLAQQTSSTNGTGTLTLNPAAAERRSFQVGLGASPIVTAYRSVVPGTSSYEIGIGTFNGGSPGTLTRSTVLASSSAGSLVSFAGVQDVIPVMLPGERPRLNVTGSATEALADVGSLITFTGSATATRTLPAAASVPPWSGFLYMNQGTAGAPLILDGNGAETINGLTTLTLFGGESVEIFSTGSAWFATGLPPVSLVRRQVASASAQIDFVLPAGFVDFEMRITDLRPATDGASLVLRTSVDSGASFAAGGSDYRYMTEEPRPPTGGYASGRVGAATGIVVSMPLDTSVAANTCEGKIRVWVGDGTRQPQAFSEFSGVHNTQEYSIHRAMGNRLAGTAINAIRLIFDTGNITAGTFSLYAVR
jgi:hypothetical protein